MQGSGRSPNLRRSIMRVRLGCFVALWLMSFETASADVVQVRDAASLKAALSKLTPETTLRIAPGEYPGGHEVRDVANLTIEAADPDKPPHFKGGSCAWHFSNCSGL